MTFRVDAGSAFTQIATLRPGRHPKTFAFRGVSLMKMMANALFSRLITAVFAGCLIGSAWSQTTGSGTITGTLRDPNQAVVPGAMVTVHNTGTGVDRVVQSNEVGLYTAPFLSPGTYEVIASKQGFTKLVRQDVL